MRFLGKIKVKVLLMLPLSDLFNNNLSGLFKNIVRRQMFYEGATYFFDPFIFGQSWRNRWRCELNKLLLSDLSRPTWKKKSNWNRLYRTRFIGNQVSSIDTVLALGVRGCKFKSRQYQCSHENWVGLKFP